MLLFSAMLDISKRLTEEAFVKLVIRWNKESTYRENIIPDLNWDGSFDVRMGSSQLWLSIKEYRPRRIVAVRYEKQESDGGIWDTDYIMNFAERKMCIRLERSYRAEALSNNPRFSTPHFITLLEQNGYLEMDGELPVRREPVFIQKEQLPLLADIITEKKRFRLPVVFVSKKFSNEDPVDPAKLAGRVKGAAHVLVQADTESGYELRTLCQSRNEFNGAAGIYFPNASIPHVRFLPHTEQGYDERMMEKLIRSVIQYSSSLAVDVMYTWQGVNNALLMDRFDAQRKARAAADHARRTAEAEMEQLLNSMEEEEKRIRARAAEDARLEADRILDEFDNELQHLQKQVAELARSNELLQYENQGLKSRLDTVNELPVLHTGEEKEFYPGEIRDLILLTLSDSLSRMQRNTRRADVIEDIILANEYAHTSEQYARDIRRLLSAYDGMTSFLKQRLQEIGFVITEDGKHYKLTWHGDDRYQIILSKTPSDHRTGKNSVQKINRTIF